MALKLMQLDFLGLPKYSLVMIALMQRCLQGYICTSPGINMVTKNVLRLAGINLDAKQILLCIIVPALPV